MSTGARRPRISSEPTLRWSEATSYQLGADAALERGDLQTWAEDNTLDDYYSDLGDGAYDQWTGQGCHH
jgi:hypothetical protein